MLKFKQFQLEDLARAALHDGLILAAEPGLGKTLQAIALALIKRPLRVLIVAPGGLHLQWKAEAREKFRLRIADLPDLRTFSHLDWIAPRNPYGSGAASRSAPPASATSTASGS